MKDFVVIESEDICGIIPKSAALERVAAGFQFTEGPVWADGRLLFNDIPRDRTVEYLDGPEGPQISTWKCPSNSANGQTMDADGNLIICEQATRRVVAVAPSGDQRVIADRYDGMKLNSPNDVVSATNKSIYFTDPPFGLPEFVVGKETPFNGVYRVAPDGEVTLVDDRLTGPNGVALSPDERTLYVADTPRLLLMAYDVEPDGNVRDRRLFCDMSCVKEYGGPDGMAVDEKGDLFCTGPGGIWVFNSSGRVLGRIKLPENPSNMAWGGSDRNVLYITATTGLYRIAMSVKGSFVR